MTFQTYNVVNRQVDARPYEEGENLANIRCHGQVPQPGGWIVRSRYYPKRQWYVTAEVFAEQYSA